MISLEAALALHRQGNLVEAERMYREIVAADPRNSDALHLLGYVALQTGRWPAAVDYIGRSLQVNPAQAGAWLNLGVACRNNHQFDRALECADRVLASEPDNLQALNNRADVLLELGRPGEALANLEAALRLRPGFVEALNNQGRALTALGQPEMALERVDLALRLNPGFIGALNTRGTVLRQLGRLDEALASFDAALARDPGSTVALFNRAGVLIELARHAEAAQCCEALLRRDPHDAETLTNLGIALLNLDRVEESVATHRRALASRPAFPRALNNLGNSLRTLGRLDEALACYDRALLGNPDDPDVMSNRGVVLTELHRYDEAVASHELALRRAPARAALLYNRGTTRLALRQLRAALDDFEKASRLRPDAPDFLFNIGFVLIQLDRCEEAAAVLDRLLQLRPDYPLAQGMRLHSLARICDWSAGSAAREQVVAAVCRGELVMEPFSFLSVSGSAIQQLQCARTYSAARYPAEVTTASPPGTRTGDRLRLAYISGDFRDHPVSRLMVGIFEHHDRTQFETIGIALRPVDASELGRRVAGAFDQLIDVSARSDEEVVRLIRDLGVDIAVDLMGSTQGQRTRIFAARAAPVQVNFIGYPGTLGASYLDYLIADQFLIPRDRQHDYEESVVHLPDCFQPNDDRRYRVQGLAKRRDHGLPEQAMVWCCFNNTSKITAAVFDVWMNLLRHTPDSVLWLYVNSVAAGQNLRREAEHRGVAAGRLVLAPRVEYAEHLERLALADVFLDTTPFCGGAVASDALWAGVPLLAWVGDAFAARMSGALLQALGLPELIATHLESYEATALKLAESPQWRAELRERLRASLLATSVFDTQRYCRHLEAAYLQMSRRSRLGEPPGYIRVEPPVAATTPD